MKTIKQYLSAHKSTYAAARYYNVTATQLHRLMNVEAKVDESGQVWVKSKTALRDGGCK